MDAKELQDRLHLVDRILAAVRPAARELGYAIAVHGSLIRDIDLVACPWHESAVNACELVEHLRRAMETVTGYAQPHDRVCCDTQLAVPTWKPLGRLAWAFYLSPDHDNKTYVDLSVLPRNGTADPVNLEACRKLHDQIQASHRG